MKYIYIVHSLIPSYFASAERALAHAWANHQTGSRRGDPAAKAGYIKAGKRVLSEGRDISPSWESPDPQVRVSRAEVQ